MAFFQCLGIIMRKSIILASLLFASSAFSDCNHLLHTGSQGGVGPGNPIPSSCYTFNSPLITFSQIDGSCSGDSGIGYAVSDTECYNRVDNYYSAFTVCPPNTNQFGTICVPNDHTCIAGMSFSVSVGGCIPTPPPEFNPNGDPMNNYNNDPAGCNAAGGYYFADGSCNGGAEALTKMFSNPLATVGAMLSVGGVTFGAGGILASAAFGATPVGVVTIGTLATIAGIGSLAAAGGSLLDWTTVPSNDVTSGETRMKVVLTTSGGSSASAGSNVTKTNITTGKVDQTTFVPSTLNTALANSANVDKNTATLLNPVSLAGLETTTFNYGTNIATTEYHLSDSTSTVPHTATTTSSFSVTQNIDGTVTTTPTNTSVAPTVSGGGGGTVVSPPISTTSTGGTGTGTNSTTGTGPDYTEVLNKIETNTNRDANNTDGILSYIKSMFVKDEAQNTFNTALIQAQKDEMDSVNTSLSDSLNPTLSTFVYVDPLGLNGLGGGAGIQPYGFTLYGHYFVVLDQTMIDQLPLDLIRSLFLFIFAILGFITVFSGV
jgi:hypothetical protein